MDLSKAALVILLTLMLVVVINLGIYYSVSRKNTIGQIELLRRAANRAKNPWQSEDNNLSELSRLVKEIQKSPPPDIPGSSEQSQPKPGNQE